MSLGLFAGCSRNYGIDGISDVSQSSSAQGNLNIDNGNGDGSGDGIGNGNTGGIQETLKKIKPALAIGSSNCLLCHSTVNGNIISDFGTPNSLNLNNNSAIIPEVKFYRQSASSGRGEYIYDNWNSYGNKSFWGTSFINGTVFVPRLNLDASTRSGAIEMIQEGKKSMQTLGDWSNVGIPIPTSSPLDSSAPESLASVAEYLRIVLNYRTPDFLNVIENWPKLSKPAGSIANSKVVEIAKINISAPDATFLRSIFSSEVAVLPVGPNAEKLKYKKAAGSNLSLSHFRDRGDFFRMMRVS